MKIAKVDTFEVEMPPADPSWRLALGVISRVDALFIKITTDDGIEGWGSTAPPWFQGETVGGVRAVIEGLFVPYLIGKDPTNIEKIMADLEGVILWNRWAKTAIEVALYDITGKALQVPVYRLLGGLVREEVPVMRIVPIKEPKEAAARCLELVGEGYKYLKIKISGEPNKDIEMVREIRKAVGEEVVLTLDANQSYKPAAAVNMIRRMEDYDIFLVEQPVRYDDWDGLATVTRAVDCLVEADESAKTPSDVFRLAAARAAGSFCLKITKMGGIGNVKKAAAICDAANVFCRVGMAPGGRIMSAANMHLIASTPNLPFAAEVGEFLMSLKDPSEGVEVTKGLLKVPSGPGLGVRVSL